MTTHEMAQHLVEEYGKLVLMHDKAKEVALKHVEITQSQLRGNDHMSLYWWDSVAEDIKKL